jgi:hypothetical protein
VQRQGGIAIAAHPVKSFWPGWPDAAMRRLDGAEICHPLIYWYDTPHNDLEAFAARAQAILDAVRAHRTVVYGLGGRAYGDPALVRLAAEDGRLRELAAPESPGGPLDWCSRIGGLLGLAGLVVFRRRSLA